LLPKLAAGTLGGLCHFVPDGWNDSRASIDRQDGTGLSSR
jgi:hypothetical protein